jgi:hypothetical protein
MTHDAHAFLLIRKAVEGKASYGEGDGGDAVTSWQAFKIKVPEGAWILEFRWQAEGHVGADSPPQQIVLSLGQLPLQGRLPFVPNAPNPEKKIIHAHSQKFILF